MRIYVAGPYTADSPGKVLLNVERAMDVARLLQQKGHDPFVPHLTHYLHQHWQKAAVDLPVEWWYRYDLNWLAACQALYYDRSSRGADAEARWAREHGLLVFHTMGEVPDMRRPTDGA